MTQYSSVACKEEHGTARYGGDINTGKNASVVLRCAWADREALMSDLLSTPRGWPNTSGVIPYAYSASSFPPPNASYTTDGNGQLCIYDEALVQVNYSTQIVDTASESIEPYLEYEDIDHRLLHWSAGTGEVLLSSESPPLLMRGLNITRTRYRLATIPAEVLTCVGKVNVAVYTSSLLGLTFAAETLLFQPGGINRTFTNFGTLGWTLSLKLSYKPETWNKFRRMSDGTWNKVYWANGTQFRAYPTGNFAALLA